jgi:hypothetical protein
MSENAALKEEIIALSNILKQKSENEKNDEKNDVV